jgi:RNA polymerase sigma factor (TIGR02999 family)
MTINPGDVTRVLHDVQQGAKSAVDRLLPLIYNEMHQHAEQIFRDERPNHTLQPTALVHDAYLKLIDQKQTTWQDRAHFFAVAATVMRRLLVDHARQRDRDKRGGNHAGISAKT